MKNTDEMREITEQAFARARAVTEEMIKNNPDTWYPCGFAWVRIKPARGELVKYLKSIKVGKTDDYAGGYVIYNPSKNSTQWMDAKYEGAKAFAEVLKEHGIKARAECRID
jgi:hypothetical protein